MNTLRSCLLLPLLSISAFAQDAGDAPPATREEPRIARLFDIGDLLARKQQTGQGNRLGPMDLKGKLAHRPPETRGLEAYVRLLRAFAKPALTPSDQITGVGERWVAAAGTAAQLAWIADFLQSAHTADAAAIHIQFTCYRTHEIAFQRDVAPALPATEAAEPEPHAYTAVLEPGAKTDAFLAALRQHEAIEQLLSPGLAIEPLTLGEMSTHNQTAYVRDFDIRVEKTQMICDPIVDVIEDGIALDACVARLPGGRLGVSIGIAVAELQRPIPTAERTVPGSKQKVTVQLPHLRSTQIDGAFELSSGQQVVLAPLPQGGERHVFVVTVIDGGDGKR